MGELGKFEGIGGSGQSHLMCVHIENPLFSELRGPEGTPYCVLRKGRRDGHVSIALCARKVSVSNGIRIN